MNRFLIIFSVFCGMTVWIVGGKWLSELLFPALSQSGFATEIPYVMLFGFFLGLLSFIVGISGFTTVTFKADK